MAVESEEHHATHAATLTEVHCGLMLCLYGLAVLLGRCPIRHYHDGAESFLVHDEHFGILADGRIDYSAVIIDGEGYGCIAPYFCVFKALGVIGVPAYELLHLEIASGECGLWSGWALWRTTAHAWESTAHTWESTAESTHAWESSLLLFRLGIGIWHRVNAQLGA